jgi:hypothetical protein
MTALSLWTLHKYLVSKIRSVVVLLTPCICWGFHGLGNVDCVLGYDAM